MRRCTRIGDAHRVDACAGFPSGNDRAARNAARAAVVGIVFMARTVVKIVSVFAGDCPACAVFASGLGAVRNTRDGTRCLASSAMFVGTREYRAFGVSVIVLTCAERRLAFVRAFAAVAYLSGGAWLAIRAAIVGRIGFALRAEEVISGVARRRRACAAVARSVAPSGRIFAIDLRIAAFGNRIGRANHRSPLKSDMLAIFAFDVRHACAAVAMFGALALMAARAAIVMRRLQIDAFRAANIVFAIDAAKIRNRLAGFMPNASIRTERADIQAIADELRTVCRQIGIAVNG